jgi:hypothetical protein
MELGSINPIEHCIPEVGYTLVVSLYIQKLTDVWMFLGYLPTVCSLRIMSVDSRPALADVGFKDSTDILNRRWAGPFVQANFV